MFKMPQQPVTPNVMASDPRASRLPPPPIIINHPAAAAPAPATPVPYDPEMPVPDDTFGDRKVGVFTVVCAREIVSFARVRMRV